MLFTIANALYELGLTIGVAKINTEGARVADVFYVRDADGAKLDAGRRSTEVTRWVLSALGEEPDQAARTSISLPSEQP